jgi:LuxR family maltose regulon positive regulatory protein
VNAFWGRFRTSVANERRADEILRENPALTAPPALPLAAAIRALLRAEFGSAQRALRRATNLPAESRDQDVRVELAVLRAWLRRGADDLGPAWDELRAALPSAAGMTREYAVAALADVGVRMGRAEQAIGLLDEAPSSPPSSVMSVARASALLALHRLGPAETALSPILTASGVPATRATLVAALIVQAKIRAAQGDDDGRAAESLVRAVELANAEILLPFVGGAEQLREVLVRHPSLADQWPIDPDGALDGATRRSVPATPDPLTDKELEVLRWLATSMSTQEIADELSLSVNTVKTHLAAIYRKLAAARRRDAVVRARALGLL